MKDDTRSPFELSPLTRELWARQQANEHLMMSALARNLFAPKPPPPPLTRWQKVKRVWNRFNYRYIERARTRVAMWIAPWLSEDGE